jgi:hypothetical protein
MKNNLTLITKNNNKTKILICNVKQLLKNIQILIILQYIKTVISYLKFQYLEV